MLDDIAIDPLSALRAATHEKHAALDGSGWFDRATIDLATYAGHLAHVDAFYRRAEPAMFAFRDALAEHGFEPDLRRKLPVIAAERARLPSVETLGITRDDERGVTREEPAFPVLPDFPAAVGCAYVLEGSTLGGMGLAAQIRERLGWESGFYGVYGARTGAMWRAFTTALSALHAPCDIASMTASAVAVFDAYGADVAALGPP